MSVVVATRNSARTLEACLSSVREQTHPAVELVVVDNSSTDDTPAIAQRFCDVFATKGPERTAQRNHGVELCKGDLLLFIDSDMVLDEGVISDGVRLLQDAAVPAVVIPELSFGEGFWTRCRMLERQCYVGDDDVEAARLFRRSDFLAVGGYDLNLNSAEDWDLSLRVAGRAKLPRTGAIIHHDEGRIGLYSSFVKRRYYAPGYLYYLAKHRNNKALSQGNSVLRPAFVRHWRDLLRHPVLTVGMFVLKFAEAVGVLQVAVEQWVLGRSRQRNVQIYASSSAPVAPVDGQTPSS